MGQEIELSKNETMELAILEIVKRKDISPERLEKFLDLQIKMEDRQNKASFQNALAMFQGECPVIKKNSNVKFTARSGNETAYDYASLDEIVHIIKPIMSRHGLSYSFDVLEHNEKTNKLITTIYHCDGFQKDFTFYFIPLHDDTKMNLSQRAKSAITYAKRGALENALGIVTAGEDDDARRLNDDCITKEQEEEILRIAEKTGLTKEKIQAKFKVETISEMTAGDAKKAIELLKKRRGLIVDKDLASTPAVEF